MRTVALAAPAAAPPRAGAITAAAALAAAAGLLAAAGWGLPALALAAAVALAALGACLPLNATRATLLAALLLVPDVPSGHSLGFLVHWSQGLTWSNFVLPALAVPLLGGAWLAGHRLTPARWPPLARGCFWLLAWSLLTLLLPWSAGAMPTAGAATLLAHWVKLALFVYLGVVLAGEGAAWQRRAGQVLVVALAVNAAVGLAQAAGWLPVFSPLAQAQPGVAARASGLFYDANMYGVLMAWALLWLLCRLDLDGRGPLRGSAARPASARAGLHRAGWWLLTLAVAGNLVAAGSRAGFAALAVGLAVLLWFHRWRPALRAALLLAVLGMLFPARSWQRIASAANTLQEDWTSGALAPAADGSTQQRLASMEQAWQQIVRHPLLGLGFGRALYLGVAAVGSGPVRPAAPFQGAQSMGLTVLAETGPVGLALFLIAIAMPLRRLWRAAATSAPALPLLAGFVGLLAGFVGLLAASFTIEVLWNARVLALTVVLTARAGAGAGEPEAAP